MHLRTVFTHFQTNTKSIGIYRVLRCCLLLKNQNLVSHENGLGYLETIDFYKQCMLYIFPHYPSLDWLFQPIPMTFFNESDCHSQLCIPITSITALSHHLYLYRNIFSLHQQSSYLKHYQWNSLVEGGKACICPMVKKLVITLYTLSLFVL